MVLPAKNLRADKLDTNLVEHAHIFHGGQLAMITKQDDIQPAEETVTDLCGNAEETVYVAKHSPPNHAHLIKDDMVYPAMLSAATSVGAITRSRYSKYCFRARIRKVFPDPAVPFTAACNA
eukprot:6180901-Pleurochrysis_carterae.AAC.1